jgi:hypothetical protein
VAAAQNVHFANISATTAAFIVAGGVYALSVVATFGGGSVQLQLLGPDGSTWLNVGAAITANGYVSQTLPPGSYRLSITTATAVYADLTRAAT